MRHLLYTDDDEMSDAVLWPGNQHFSAAFAFYNELSEAALSINEKAAGLETRTRSCRPAANVCGADLPVCRAAK